MPQATTTQTRTKPRTRINRSVSFPADAHAFVTREAKRQKRSFNYIVNDFIQKELDASK